MPTCDQTTIDANRLIALQLNPNLDYYEIYVHIDSSNPTTRTITFTAENLRDSGHNRTFTMTWGDLADMWPACPSTLPSQAQGTTAGPVPSQGATGTLYISEEYVRSNQLIATPTKWPKVQ